MPADFIGDLLIRAGLDATRFQEGMQRIADLAVSGKRRVEQVLQFAPPPPPAPPTPPAPPGGEDPERKRQEAQQATAAAAAEAESQQVEANTRVTQSVVELTDREKRRIEALEEGIRRAIAAEEALRTRREAASRTAERPLRLGAATDDERAAVEKARREVQLIDQQRDTLERKRIDLEARITEVVTRAGERRTAVLEREANASALQVDRFTRGVARGALREILPAVGVPVPFFGGPAFIAGAVATSVLLAGLKAIAESLPNLIDRMAQLSRVTGSTTEEVARLSIFTRQFGVSNEDLIAVMSAQQSLARTNSIALEALGVSSRLASGAARDGVPVFFETVEALRAVEDPTLRVALAYQIYGKAAETLLPILTAEKNQFDDSSKSAKENADSLAEAARRAAEVASAADRAKSAWQNFTDNLGSNAAKIAGGIVDIFDVAQAGQDAFNQALREGASLREAVAAQIRGEAEARARIERTTEEKLHPKAPPPPPPPGIADLQRITQDAQTFRIASEQSFSAAARATERFGTSIDAADAKLRAAALGLSSSVAGIADQFNLLTTAGVLGPQTERIVSIAVKLNFDPGELRRIFDIAEGITGQGADQLARTIRSRLGTALGESLEAQIIGPLERIEDQATSLQDRLEGISQSRAARAQAISDREVDAAERRANRLQRIADEESDHQDRLQERREISIRVLGEFRKAELDAAVRAREEEKTFISFRPDTTARDEREEARRQRNIAREAAQNAQAEAREARTAARQREADARAAEREARDEKRIASQLAAIELAHPDIEAELALARDNLAVAKSIVAAELERISFRGSEIDRQRQEQLAERRRRITSPEPQEVNMNLKITSPDGSVSAVKMEELAGLVIPILAQQADVALQIVRGGGGGGGRF